MATRKSIKSTKSLIDIDTKTVDENTAVEAPKEDVQADVVDIKIEMPTKSRFRINGDPNKILLLNISDMGVINRLESSWDALQREVKKVGDLNPEDEDFTKKLKKIDDALRNQIDFIFDSNVSEVCASEGTMYDPYKGQLRYEHILDTLLELYEKNINSEYKKLKTRLEKRTSKYTGR